MDGLRNPDQTNEIQHWSDNSGWHAEFWATENVFVLEDERCGDDKIESVVSNQAQELKRGSVS